MDIGFYSSEHAKVQKKYSHHSEKKTTRNVKTQKGETHIPQQKNISTRASSTHTLTKRRKLLKTRTVANLPPVKKLPGRCKSTKAQVPQSGALTKNKCVKCKRKYLSEDDLQLRDELGAENWKWLGCDVSECPYWGHAKCLRMEINGKSSKGLENLPLLCPAHKSKN